MERREHGGDEQDGGEQGKPEAEDDIFALQREILCFCGYLVELSTWRATTYTP